MTCVAHIDRRVRRRMHACPVAVAAHERDLPASEGPRGPWGLELAAWEREILLRRVYLARPGGRATLERLGVCCPDCDDAVWAQMDAAYDAAGGAL